MIVGFRNDMSSLAWFYRSRAPNLAWRERAALCAVGRCALGMALATTQRSGVTLGRAATGNVKDIELALSCGLDGVFLRRIMGNMIAVHDILCQGQ